MSWTYTHEGLLLTAVLHLHRWPTVRLGNNLERPLGNESAVQHATSAVVGARNLPVLRVVLHLSIAELASNETLEGEDSVGRVDDSLTLRRETDEALAVLGERDDRRCCPGTLGVLDHPRSLALHDGNARICRTKINTDNGACIDASALVASASRGL